MGAEAPQGSPGRRRAVLMSHRSGGDQDPSTSSQDTQAGKQKTVSKS